MLEWGHFVLYCLEIKEKKKQISHKYNRIQVEKLMSFWIIMEFFTYHIKEAKIVVINQDEIDKQKKSQDKESNEEDSEEEESDDEESDDEDSGKEMISKRKKKKKVKVKKKTIKRKEINQDEINNRFENLIINGNILDRLVSVGKAGASVDAHSCASGIL